MKYFALLFSVLIFSHSSAREPQIIPTGYQPLAIHQVGDTVHVFCNGNDIDFDGIYEPASGEKPAMWLQYDANTYMLMKFKIIEDGYFSVPFRPGLSGTKMFLAKGNMIQMYDLSTQELIDSALYSLPDSKSIISGIHVVTSTNQSGIESDVALAISHKTSFTGNGQLSVLSLISRQLLFQAEVGINPQAIISHKNLRGQMVFAVLCEGTFGGKNSTLCIVNPAQMGDSTFVTTFPLGDTGNYFLIQDQLALTVMNGSHEIIPVNLATNTVLPGIPVGTSGYDGPREIVIDTISARVYVSTYASDIRIGALNDGTVLGEWYPGGKPEGMALVNNVLWACNAFKKGEYAPDSTIALFTLDEASSVMENTLPDESISVALLNGQCSIQIKAEYSNVHYQVLDTKGRVVKDGAMHGNYHSFSFNDLPKGLYLVTVYSDKVSRSELVVHYQ